MKKTLSCLIAVMMLVVMLTACSGSGEATQQKTEKLKIVTTIFPQYDWVREIVGDKADHAELALLIDKGVDLHSYQPTTDDIIKISTCDVFIYVGGESDAWVEDALKNATNKDMVVINLLEAMGDTVKEEEIKEGMEHAHDHEEIDPNGVKDRLLADWQGEWSTIETALDKGSLDDFADHKAEENKIEPQAQKEALAKLWKSDYKTLKITENIVTFDVAQEEYTYIGYKIVDGDHGAAVWYGFEAKDTSKQVPKYIAFSDHGTGSDEEHHEDAHDEKHEDEKHSEEDHHDEHQAAHFHLRYGSESFEALTAMEDWAPTYFAATATGDEIAEAMSGHGHDHSHEGELDEHVWLSLKNAQTLTNHIATKLGEVDAVNADNYRTNAKTYNDKLSALNDKYSEAVKNGSYHTLLFADRFPFRYLIDDYGLEYYAAFTGCSAETEASFETVVFLSDKINQLDLKRVIVLEDSDQAVAKTVIQSTKGKDQKILVLNSLQSVTTEDIAKGATYLSIMESNLEAIIQALSPQ